MKTFKDYFDKIYCINYVEAPERRESIMTQLSKLNLTDGVEFSYGMPFHKIESIKKCLSNGDSDFKEDLNIKTKACALNHYTAIKTAYETGANTILIFEDDCTFIKNRDTIVPLSNTHWKRYLCIITISNTHVMTLDQIKDLCSYKFFHDERYKTLIHPMSNFEIITHDKLGTIITANCYMLGMLDHVDCKICSDYGMTTCGKAVIAFKANNNSDFYINPDFCRVSPDEAKTIAKRLIEDNMSGWGLGYFFKEED